MTVGDGEFRYEPVKNWAQLPDGWEFGWIPGVAVDSRDRVYVYSRSEHPMMVFDEDGRFLTSWGDDILADAHGIFIDDDDNVYCTERLTHCVHKFDADGTLRWTLGSPGIPRPPGVPFNLPTDLALAPDGGFYVSDGYGNHKVHKFDAEGVLEFSWGRPGKGPGEFDLVHSVWVADEVVYICDRENNRIQLFNLGGQFIEEWTEFLRPEKIWEDAAGRFFLAEVGHRVTVLEKSGAILCQWGEAGDEPDQFVAYPHGIWGDSRGDLYVSEVGAPGQLTKFVRTAD